MRNIDKLQKKKKNPKNIAEENKFQGSDPTRISLKSPKPFKTIDPNVSNYKINPLHTKMEA